MGKVQAEKRASDASELKGWNAIATFLGMPISTVHRWKKEGMPVRRAGRSVVASPDELNVWLQRSSGESPGVHVATTQTDLLRDLRASVSAQQPARPDSLPASAQKRGSPTKKRR